MPRVVMPVSPSVSIFPFASSSLAPRPWPCPWSLCNVRIALIYRLFNSYTHNSKSHTSPRSPIITDHEVRLTFTFETAAMMSANGVDTTVDPTAQLFADYVYLDSSERKRFSQSSHELLITCLQHTGAETVAPGASAKTNNIRLNLNHPVRSLSWVLKGAQHGGYTVGPRGTTNDRWAPLASAKLQLNGHDRFDERKGSYFNQVQPFQTTGCSPAAGIYNYSFALKPQEIVQPSGSCNFSRIDNSTLVLTTKAGSVATTGDALANVLDENTTVANVDGNLTSALIFAESYNVLRVLSGMGGLAYSS